MPIKAFDAYLETQESALEVVKEMLHEHERVCLMCFEANPAECHRTHVAEHLLRDLGDQVTVEPVETWQKRSSLKS